MPDDPLMEIVYRAVIDEAFFKALVKDVDAALKTENIRISKSQTERLKRAMRNAPTDVQLDLPAMLREIHAHDVSLRWVKVSWVGPSPMGDDDDDDE